MVETSGDTGPAAIAGAGCAHVSIHCLSAQPRFGRQELRAVTVNGNVFVYRTKGNTDEQAEALKAVFTDAAFSANVVSINSINWARDGAGVVLRVGVLAAARGAAAVNFVVPSGALGTRAAASSPSSSALRSADRMRDERQRHCGSHDRDWRHRPGRQRQLLSPAMDIQFAYNLERCLFLASGGDTAAVRAHMLPARRGGQVRPRACAAVRRAFVSCAVSDEQRSPRCGGCGALRHRALPALGGGFHAFERDAAVSAACAGAPTICVLTAHPAKFGDAVAAAGLPPQSTPEVDALQLPQRFSGCGPAPPTRAKRAAWATFVRRRW